MIPRRRSRPPLVCLLASLGALLATAGEAHPAPGPAIALQALPAQSADVPWPTREWPTGPIPASVSRPALEELVAVVGQRHRVLGETRAVVVIHQGRLVLERYAPGIGPQTPLISWSVAKSITSALVGIAVGKGLVDIDQPLANPRWGRDDPRAPITWRQWMNMVDGQQFREIGVESPTENDSARMLFGAGRLDVAAFASALPLVHPPGKRWNYNSAGVNLVADALGRVFAPGVTVPAERRARFKDVMSRELFGPLGMSSASPQFDAAGTFLGSALFYATARDYARFGLLYLRDGLWEGRRLLPPGWVDLARTVTGAERGGRYGAGWWVEPAPGADVSPQFRPVSTSAGPDIFTAQGFQGQLIVVVPSRDLVVVRLGLIDDRIGWPPLRDWTHRLIALFPRQTAP